MIPGIAFADGLFHEMNADDDVFVTASTVLGGSRGATQRNDMFKSKEISMVLWLWKFYFAKGLLIVMLIW